jgi:hypothetical protein
MYEQHNKEKLDGIAKNGSINYVHARNTLAIDPTPEMEQRFDERAHRGLIRKYNNDENGKVLYVDHGTADRLQFQECIAACGYDKWRVEYTTR